MTLLDFVRDTVELWTTEGVVEPDFPQRSTGIRQHLASLAERYAKPAPTDGEEIRELMAEAVDLFRHAFDCLLYFHQKREDDILDEALESAQEGDDLLQSVNYAIEQSLQAHPLHSN